MKLGRSMNTDFHQELEASIKKCEYYGRLDFWLSEGLYWLAVGSSIFATINVGAKWVADPAWVGVMAALPAAVLIIDKRFQYRERSNWHYEYLGELCDLRRQCRDRGVPLAEVSRKRSHLTRAMEATYPGRQHTGHPVRNLTPGGTDGP